MRRPDVQKFLADALSATRECREAVGERTADEFIESRPTKRVVERTLEIVGEALRRARSADPSIETEITDAPRYVQLRNVITHGYDVIDYGILWRIVHDELPILERELEALLTKP
jgi:uncharacterized protein with HEPN domain